jgi:hypothetical protein
MKEQHPIFLTLILEIVQRFLQVIISFCKQRFYLAINIFQAIFQFVSHNIYAPKRGSYLQG